MKKLLPILLFLMASSFCMGQQSITCTLDATKALGVTSFSCSPSPNNEFSGTFTATVNAITVTVTPNPATLVVNSTQQFMAAVANASDTSVTWTASGGTIDNTGLYTASAAGTFTVTATSNQDNTVSGVATVTVNAVPPSTGADNIYCPAPNNPTFGSTDGPATLPQACSTTAESSTPAPGATTSVPNGGNLQTYINAANCGDTLNLAVASTFTGVFTLPNKACDSAHWIRIQSAASPSLLPAEGSRETPCYSGVASLPNRPSLNCASTTVETAKIITDGASAFITADGANHYRIGPGLEITSVANPPANDPDTLVSITGTSVLPSNVVLDRLWIHGNGTFARVGYRMEGQNLSIIDSTITDVKAVGKDNYGIYSNTGTGPFKITDVFVEGGTASILFGQSAAVHGNPINLEIRRNHLFIPLTEEVGGPLWDGKNWSVGPRLQIYNATQALIEGNILENAWGNLPTGFQQSGDGSIAWVGAKNFGSACFTCTAGQIVIRYNVIRHAGGGFYLFDVLSNTGATTVQATSFSEHDNQLDDISTAWARSGASAGAVFRMFGTLVFPPPNFVSIVHNTGISSSGSGFLGLGNNNPISPYKNFVFQNNIVYQNTHGIFGCNGVFGAAVLNSCTIAPTFSNNLIVGKVNVVMPAGDFYAATSAQVGYANFNGGNGGNYTLCTGINTPVTGCTGLSPYATSATDGTAVGADINAITQATNGVN